MSTRRNASSRALVIASALLVAAAGALTGVPAGPVPAAAADPPACGAPWPASPAAVATFSLEDGSLCFAFDPVTMRPLVTVPGSNVGVVGDVVLSTYGEFVWGEGVALVARDGRTGAERWRAPTAGMLIGARERMRGDDGLVVVPAEVPGSVVARDLATGAERWRTQVVDASSVPVIANTFVETASIAFVVIHGPFGVDSGTVALDRRTGAELWRSDNHVIDASEATAIERSFGELVAVDPVDRTVLWRRPSGAWIGRFLESGVFVGTGPMGTGHLVGLDERTGEVRWERPLEGELATTGDGLVFVNRTSGPGAGLQALDVSTGAERWARPGLGRVLAVGDGVVAVNALPITWSPHQPPANVGAVEVLDASTGTTRFVIPPGPWRVEPGHGAIGGGLLVIGRQPSSIPDIRQDGAAPHCVAGTVTPVDSPTVPPTRDPSQFIPLPPTRLLDSRHVGGGGYLCPGERITLRVIDQAGIPAADVSAVALNVTITGSGRAGFVTVWPGGEAQPLASHLNFTGGYQTRPNLVVVPVGADGTVNVVTQGGGYLVVDVAGYFTPATAASAGRIVPIGPQRLLDTRDNPAGGAGAAPPAPIPAGGTRVIPVAGPDAAVPEGAAAAIVTLTSTQSAGAGFVTAWATGIERPLASNLNVDPAADTANLAIIPLGADGTFSVLTQSPTHLLVDLVAYVTGPTAASGTSGLFVPLSPARVFDTRTGAAVTGGSVINPAHRGVGTIPADAVAVLLNVTAVDATAPSHVRVWAGAEPIPLTSSLNLAPGDTRAAATLVRIGTAGGVGYLLSFGRAHLLADVAGALTAGN